MSKRNATAGLVVVAFLWVLLGAGAVVLHLVVRDPAPLRLDDSTVQRVEPWPDGIVALDSWSGADGPPGDGPEPKTESLYVLLSGEGAGVYGDQLAAAVIDHLRSAGWDVQPEGRLGWDIGWGYSDPPGSYVQVALFDSFVESPSFGSGVDRTKAELRAAHGSEPGLVVVKITASER